MKIPINKNFNKLILIIHIICTINVKRNYFLFQFNDSTLLSGFPLQLRKNLLKEIQDVIMKIDEKVRK